MKKTPPKCPTCARPMARLKKIADALRMVNAGVRPAAAARAAGISRQLLRYHLQEKP